VNPAREKVITFWEVERGRKLLGFSVANSPIAQRESTKGRPNKPPE
jgi:hypothetical protein